MSFAVLRGAVFRSVRFLVSDAGLTILAGVLAGLCLLGWVHQFTALFGLSLPVVTGLAAAIGMTVELAWRPLRHGSGRARAGLSGPSTNGGSAGPSPWLTATCLLVPATWTVAFGWLAQAALAAVAAVPLETMANPLLQAAVAGAAALGLLGVPVYCLARCPAYLHELRDGTDAAGPAVSEIGPGLQEYVLGIVLGLTLGVFFLAPFVAVGHVGLFAALGVAVLSLELARRAARSVTQSGGVLLGNPVAGREAEPGHHDAAADRLPLFGKQWRAAISVGCLGAALALLSRVINQLMPTSAFLLWAEWTSVILGALAGLIIGRRAGRRASGESRVTDYRAAACLMAAGWCAAVPLAFSWYVSALLAANSFVSIVWLQMVIRSVAAASLLLPLGVAWGLLAGQRRPEADRALRAGSTEPGGRVVHFPPIRVFAFVTGYLLTRWTGIPQWGVADCLVIVSIALLACAFLLWLPARSLPRGWLRRAGVFASFGLVVTSGWLRESYDPPRAARLLFSTNVFLAKRAGMPARLLPYLDEGRLMACREGARSTYTVWKFRGGQLQIREGGISKSIVAGDRRYARQQPAELMQAVLPLVLHERPHRVLLLGLQGGVPLSTCLAFPVQQVTCAEADGVLTSLVDEVVWQPSERAPLDDDRVRFVHVDPALAVACDDGRYDVVVSSADRAALAHATPHFTAEFYRRVSQRLAAGGIFCQRFQYVDFGARPLQVLVRTAESAFRTVGIVETDAGELLLLATNSKQGLLRKGLVTRLKAPHVRRTLSRAGWDWVVPLNLSGYDHEALKKFAGDDGVRANTAASGWFAFRSPQDVMRWGAKWQEIREQFAQKAGSLLQWAEDQQTPEALHRLEEVAGRRNLIARYPDQKWSYRKTLKSRMLDKPQTVIQQVKGEGLDRRPHPQHLRRKRYLKALGQAVRDPSPESIAQMLDCVTPYDPLVSYFAHEEAARLCSRCRPAMPRQELLHRLHLAYFSPPGDRSVRNIVAALQLLVNEPKAAPDPMARRDHIDALLQLLTSRWQARGRQIPIPASIAERDAEMSIAAAEKAFETLERLSKDLSIDTDAWRARRLVLERSLVRPLRTYRAQLLERSKNPRRAGPRQD